MSYKIIPGLRVKFRTEQREDGVWAVATVWNEEQQKPVQELARLWFGDHKPELVLYHQWVDTVSAWFMRMLEQRSGVQGIVHKRHAPNYHGE